MIMNQEVFLNFEVIEVTAPSKEEAAAQLPFSIMKDATMAFNNWKKKQEGAITELMKKSWMIDYIEANSKNAPGVGFTITLEPAVADTREHPYSYADVKNTQGRRVFTRVFQLVDSETHKILGLVEGTKAEAAKVAKKIIEDGHKGEIEAYITHHVTEGEKLAFKVKYTPSKNAHNGTWIAFGIKA